MPGGTTSTSSSRKPTSSISAFDDGDSVTMRELR
jgi:hypothetical protein